jgi:hypothetical protein
MFEGVFSVMVVGILYLMPTIIAGIRGNRYAAVILIINLTLGWTVLFWLFCLAWSFWPEENKNFLKEG